MKFRVKPSFFVLSLVMIHFASGMGALLGGFSEPQKVSLSGLLSADADDSKSKDVLIAVNKAVEMMNDNKASQHLSSEPPISLVDVQSYRIQVVAGIKYDLTIKVSIDGKEETCKIFATKLVYSDKWIVVASSDQDPCHPYTDNSSQKSVLVEQKRSAQLLGGERKTSEDNEDVKAAAQWAVKHINSISNSFFSHRLLKVAQAKKQVINGYRYRLQLTTAATSCRNKPENSNKSLKECPVSDTAEMQDCSVSVIYSLGKYTMEQYSCHKTTQDSILGGDDHDYTPHGLLGGDDHDYRSHGHRGSADGKMKNLRNLPNNVMQMNILGGDDHDFPQGEGDCSQYKEDFEAFKTKHNKLYESGEEAKRFIVFCKNMEKVKHFYQKHESGSAVYGASKFADMSEAEFKKKYLGLKPEMAKQKNWSGWSQAKIPEGPVPASWDWREHGAVTAVKNQGECGSCWAFSTTGNIEGQWAIVNKKLVSLSEQELVDCDKLDEGCNGGLPTLAYDSIMKLGGLETEADYKYDGHGEKCKFDKTEVVATLTGAVNISKDEGEMAAWLYKNGPISIGINAFAMQFYLGGIAHPWKIFCNPKDLDHGVLIVGYGVEKGEPYWIVKNSWGAEWGREGYYYVYRGDGTCGLNTMCTSAQVTRE